MNKHIERHIFGIVLGGMICFISACNNDSVSEKQADSFLKYYAVDTYENTGTEVIQTSDGYTVMGNIEGAPTGQKDMFVVLTDEFGRQTGDPLVIGTDDDDDGYSMIRLEDGGYIIAGTSYNTTQREGYLANISSDGQQIIWEQNFDNYQELEFRDVYEANDGNLILTGSARGILGDKEVIICKVTTQGELRWIRLWPGLNRNDVGVAIIEYDELYHILITSAEVNNIQESIIRVLTTDTDGRAPTSLLISENYLSGKDLTVNLVGQIYILANKQDPASRLTNIYLAELELKEVSGGKLMDMVKSAIIPFDESLYAESFALVEENNLAIGGSQGPPNDNLILFLLVDNGNGFQISMLNTFGSKGSQTSQNIIYTSDQGYALTGSVDLAGLKTSMLLKTGSDGELK